MGNCKRKQPGALKHKSKSKRANRPLPEGDIFVPRDVVARRPLPVVKSKHRSYFELVQNADKKKKLEFQNTLNPNPPQGFEFVPVGNPELTSACKELSRDRGLKIYIVAVRHDITNRFLPHETYSHEKSHEEAHAHSLATQMNRVGYHFHANVVREAKASIHHVTEQLFTVPGIPEPIPECQSLYYTQADAVLRDLFPRVPNTDRQSIILHSFTEGALYNGGTPVGRNPTLTLSRRVQLAVLAHIRHAHTLYDDLLRRMPWHDARKAVQPVCLDTLVKWRGDEESGRDQLDEILREVVVISDSEDEDAMEDSTDDTSVISSTPTPSDGRNVHRRLPVPDRGTANVTGGGRNDRRGFERYRRAWDDAVRRNGETRHDAAGSFHDGDGAALPGAPETRMAHDASGNAPAPNGYVPPGLQVYRAGPRMIATNDDYQEVNAYARDGLRLPLLPSASSNPDMLVHPAAGVEQPSYRPRAYPSLGTGPDRPLVYENRSMQYYFGSSPSPARPPRESWRTDGHVHRGELRPMSPVQMSGCHRDRYGMPSNPAQVQSTQPAAERIVMNSARPGSRSNTVVMEDRGGFYERIADHPEDAGLQPRSDGVPRSSVAMHAPERTRSGPHGEPASYRSPSPLIIPRVEAAGGTVAPSWRVDRRPGFVSHMKEDHRPQEELRFQQVRSGDAHYRHHQQPRQDVDDDCIFIRQRPTLAANHIDLTL
ncbi:hypothetical protein L249_3256 [Ophiocordyceps polyrhachis-furcata BCC 54312]|uniref:DUF2293 domain-containing protein n=1 Tax=Ophiocordyceps polyrhachis-furcata BCC 54312 TaxID=1330021 RepID=A0A367LRP3_9HYPO|nr:hypothetical protein L249_3256 [Ophiocordyceps polyrhachis-furcata BCC 54312]